MECEGQSVLGVIRIPALDECVYAARGQGAWYVAGRRNRRGRRASRSGSRLAKALFLTSEVINFDKTGRRAAYDRLQAAARLTRTWGDGYGYLMVATGRADVMVDPIMALWDAAALPPILEEAGGTFTDWQGNPTITPAKASPPTACCWKKCWRRCDTLARSASEGSLLARPCLRVGLVFGGEK